MTKLNKLLIVTSAALVTLIGCATADMGYATYASADDWAEKTKTGPALPLAKEPDVWSDMKTFGTPMGPVGVQSKFLHQQGTTCFFEVKFTNNGKTKIDQQVMLGSRITEKVFSHRLTRISVAPGTASWWEMEKRGCPLKWGTSKEMHRCAECAPLLVFLRPQ